MASKRRCGDCQGVGHTLKGRNIKRNGRWVYAVEKITCPSCKGTGEVDS